ncbi:MAG: endonuclease [Paludibacteraceae bacterium]|nr:endonuclease [Paludibacteraceae bacterium]
MRKYLLVALMFVVCTVSATIPNNYYSAVNGKSGSAILPALYGIISSHTDVGYDGLYSVYPQTDSKPGTNQVWDIYSTCTFTHGQKKCGSYSTVCDCYNREHTTPQSWFGSGKPKTDVFNVYPTDGKVNGQRSNYPYGECANGTRLTSKALGKLGTSTFSGYSGKVFEPDDEYKGDLARSCMYMVACYYKTSFTETANGAVTYTYSGGVTGLTSYAVDLFMKWHREDPVSQKEIDRNNAAYSKQRNRNPFIDYPCLAEYIWGQYKGQTVVLENLMSTEDAQYNSSDKTGCNCSATVPTLQEPQRGTTLNIGNANVGETISSTLRLSGDLLTKGVQLTISGTNASYFSVSKTSLTASEVNNGVSVTISYHPNATGSHSAILTISSTEISACTITLTGSSTASLVSPTQQVSDIIVYDVNETVEQELLIKGVNLTRDVQLKLASGTYASLFSISATQLTAAEVNAGKTVRVKYTPNVLGKHSINLQISSLGGEFSTRTIALTGQCLFDLLPPTNIHSNSAQLNWTNAGVASYVVDVYQKTIQGNAETIILSDVNGAKATKGGYTAVESESLRMGSGSQLGSITYKNLDLSNGGVLKLTAKYYKEDNSSLLIKADTYSDTVKLSSAFVTYEVNIPAVSSAATLEITTMAKGKRAFVTTVEVVSGGEKEVKASLSGYPQTVYGALYHQVTGLVENEEYFYTVTPEGYSVSEEGVFVTEEGWTGNLFVPFPQLEWYVNPNGVGLVGVNEASQVSVYNSLGQMIYEQVVHDGEVFVQLHSGIYLLKVQHQDVVQVIKVQI